MDSTPNPGIEGHWSGAVVRENAVQLVDVRLAGSGDTLSGTYDIPELGLFDVPLRILYGPFALHHHSDVGQLTGSNERWNPLLALHLKRQATRPERSFVTKKVDYANGEVAVEASGGRLEDHAHPALADPLDDAVVQEGRAGDDHRR